MCIFGYFTSCESCIPKCQMSKESVCGCLVKHVINTLET